MVHAIQTSGKGEGKKTQVMMEVALLILGKIVTVTMPVGQNAGPFYYASIMLVKCLP